MEGLYTGPHAQSHSEQARTGSRVNYILNVPTTTVTWADKFCYMKFLLSKFFVYMILKTIYLSYDFPLHPRSVSRQERRCPDTCER